MYVVYFDFCISVKRKGGAVIDLLEVGDETNCSEDEAIVENQHIHRGVKLLANEEFDKETGGYESESEEDEPDQPEETVQVETASAGNAGSKKRKASRKLKSPKYVLNSISKKCFSCDLYCICDDISDPRGLKWPQMFDLIYFALNHSVLF